jgi:hypothetical protein
MKVEELAAVVDELVDVLRYQAEILERLITRVEQVSHRLPEDREISVVHSSLSGLRVRMRKLLENQGKPGS